MDCENVRDLLQECLDGALPDSTARAVKTHLESCEECALEFRLLSKIDAALRSEPMEDVPGNFAAAVRERLVQSVAYSWRDVAMAAASIAVVVSLFWLAKHVGVTALVHGDHLDPLAGVFSVFEIEDTALERSVAEINQWASETYGSTLGHLASITTQAAGSRTVVVLIASAMLAIGTNAVCLHRARIRHLTTTHL